MKTALHSFVKRLVKDISALPEEVMKVILLCKRLSMLKPVNVAIVLDAIYNEETGHLPEYRALQMVIVNHKAISEILGADKIKLYLSGIP